MATGSLALTIRKKIALIGLVALIVLGVGAFFCLPKKKMAGVTLPQATYLSGFVDHIRYYSLVRGGQIR